MQDLVRGAVNSVTQGLPRTSCQSWDGDEVELHWFAKNVLLTVRAVQDRVLFEVYDGGSGLWTSFPGEAEASSALGSMLA
jgi:hypothetical protein